MFDVAAGLLATTFRGRDVFEPECTADLTFAGLDAGADAVQRVAGAIARIAIVKVAEQGSASWWGFRSVEAGFDLACGEGAGVEGELVQQAAVTASAALGDTFAIAEVEGASGHFVEQASGFAFGDLQTVEVEAHGVVFCKRGSEVSPTVVERVLGDDGSELALTTDMEARFVLVEIKSDADKGAAEVKDGAVGLVRHDPGFDGEGLLGRIEQGGGGKADRTCERSFGRWGGFGFALRFGFALGCFAFGSEFWGLRVERFAIGTEHDGVSGARGEGVLLGVGFFSGVFGCGEEGVFHGGGPLVVLGLATVGIDVVVIVNEHPA